MSSYMGNMMISIGLMVVVQSAVNSYFGFETPATCGPGVNDNSWTSQYNSVQLFHPQSITRTSQYLELLDGVKLAADVYTSEQAEYHGMKAPTIIHFTRHSRGYSLDFPFSKISARGDFINPRTSAYINKFVTEGYAWVAVDVRGTGASFGTKNIDFHDQEAEDAKEVIEWITQQPWSNGEVSAFGVGLEGVTALVLAANPHPALKSIALNGVPAELFDSALIPGGVHNNRGIQMYSSFCSATDNNYRWDEIPHLKSRLMMKHFGGNVYPVNSSHPEELARATAEHKSNPILFDEIASITYRDDTFTSVPTTFAEFDSRRLFEKLAKSPVAILSLSGYYDMGASRSSIWLYQYLTGQMDDDTLGALGLPKVESKEISSTQYRLILGPWSHGNVDTIDPFAEAKTRCFEPIEEVSRFFDYHSYPQRQGISAIDTEEPVHYFTLGENKWKTTTEWPPALIDQTTTYFLSDEKTMVDDVAEIVDGEQTIDINPSSTTLPSVTTRWNIMDHIFLNKPTYAHNRDGIEKDLISFTSPKLHQRELTGEMTLKIYFSVNAPIVNLFAYLEDVNMVAPIDQRLVAGAKVRGGITYITEGIVNPLHQSIAPGSPLRTFLKADGRVIEPDQIYEATFNFYPTSYLVAHEHQLRVTIAGAEYPSFALENDKDAATKLSIHYSAQYPSSLTIKSHEIALPVHMKIVKDSPNVQVKEEDEFAEKIELGAIVTDGMIQAPIAASAPARPLYLNEAQQSELYHQSRNHAVAFLQNSLSDLHEWEFISEKKNVQFYRKKSSDGTTYTINAITRIVADLDDTMRTLYCEDTMTLCNLFSQLHDDTFAEGAVLANLPAKRDPTGVCREQCSVKSIAFRPFNAVDKARQYTVVDYCTLRTGKTDEKPDENGVDNRLGIQLMYSTDIAEPPKRPANLGTANDVDIVSQLLPSGFIVYPTTKKGVLEVIFSWSAHDPRGISRGYKKAILSLVSSVARLENIFLALRIAASGFIKSKNWVNDKDRSYCFICRESFGAFRRRHHCRLCGDITCSKCATITAVKLPVVGLCQVRICNRCLTENDTSRSSNPNMSNSGNVPKAPPAPVHSNSIESNDSANSGRQHVQVMERLSHGMSNLSAVRNCIDSDDDDSDEMSISGDLSASAASSSLMGSRSMSSSLATSNMGGSFSQTASGKVGGTIEEEFDEAAELASSVDFIPLNLVSHNSSSMQVKPFLYKLTYTDQQKWPLAPIPSDEAPRLRKLDELRILDTPMEQEFNHIAQSAAEALGTAFGFVSFIDDKREWVKACYGMAASAAVPRDISITAHAIMSYEVMAVPNLTLDVRFKDNPLVTDNGLRFFVGFPLVTNEGYIVGALAAADTKVKENITQGQVAKLKRLSNHVTRLLEERAHYHNPVGYVQPPQSYSSNAAQANIHNALLDLLKKTEATGKTLQQTQSMMNQSVKRDA
ncbi:serine protease family S15 [Thraustotheca clavata]|uniref:Serine protease family S15 n=1 Tax=Thraustotheca clavata TaxID=74557 RepID=A0A1W0A7I4_9STRA|nr:serine protease family S15 [Thraustotheca clavata]